MKVSIVTISFNQAQYLEQCIQSVIDQDYPEIEYIIVDPGSTDVSREIIEKYRSKIAHVIFEKDSGPADGLNKGFKLATGDILGYINSDDYYLPSAIQLIVAYFQNHSNIDVVSGNAHVVNGRNELLRYTYSDRYSLLACAYGYSILIQPSSFFRAEAFNRTNWFNIDNHSSWDGELFIDMKLKGTRFGRINEYLSAFRIHKTSITGSGILKKQIRTLSDNNFNIIMGRNRKLPDIYIGNIFRLYRYITNVRDLYQRLRFGPIFGRYSDNLKNEKS